MSKPGLTCFRRFLFSWILVILTVIYCLFSAGPGDCRAQSYNVGLRIMDFEYERADGENETVTVAVWYPTEETAGTYIYHTQRDYESKVTLGAWPAMSGRPYPLILFAHGAFGSGYNSAFFMEYLARHGYIAVAPDYVDTQPPEYKQQIAFSRIKGGKDQPPLVVLKAVGQLVKDMSADRDFYLSYLAEHRFGHTTFVIDKILELNRDLSSPFYQIIDEDKIGICGHSEGGLTVMGKIGAHPDNEFTDERIKAALIFSAPAYPFEETAKNINISVMFMAGDNDLPAFHPEFTRRLIYDEVRPPKFYMVLKDATHLTFGNTGCGYQVPLYLATQSVPQISAICRYGLAFFERYLRGNTYTGKQLEKFDPALAYYIKEEQEGELFEWGTEPLNEGEHLGRMRKEIRDHIKEKILQKRKR